MVRQRCGRIKLTFTSLGLVLVLLGVVSCSAPASNNASIENMEDPAVEATEAGGAEEEGSSVSDSEGEANDGGTIRVAVAADPQNIDPHLGTNPFESRTIALHVYEHLFTYNAEGEVVPMLAESVETSDDGRTVTIKIREGISFHDGSSLTSEDVVASLQRWLKVGGRIATLISTSFIDDPESDDWVRATDEYTIEATFTEPNGVFLQGLADIRRGAYIVPNEIAEAWGTELANDASTFIGTGPYQVADWTADQSIRLERFDEYVPREEEPSWYSGRRTAFADAIEFLIVPDPSVRAGMLEVGDVDFMASGSVADLARLQNSPEFFVVRGVPNWYDHFYFNLRDGIFALSGGEKAMSLRHAVQAAIDVEEVAAVVYGDPLLWRLDSSYLFQESFWWSDAGAEYYNQADPEKAQELMEEAGYDGEVIRFRTGSDFSEMQTWTEVVAEQLRNVGFNVEVEVYDMATYTDMWGDSEGWELSSLYMSYRDEPLLLPMYPANDIFARPTPEEYPELYEMYRSLGAEVDPEVRYEIQEALQEKFYAEALHVRLADVFEVRVASNRLQGFVEAPEMFFWNVQVGSE